MVIRKFIQLYYRLANYVHRRYRKYLTMHRKQTHIKNYDVLPFSLNYQFYDNAVCSQDRFLMVGWDDFCPTDISWVMPLFEKYGFVSTFNCVASGSYRERLFINRAQQNGHEIGDHTFMHERYPYFSPLYNGYDPNHPDGSNQQPYPSNDDMRCDRGDGCNAFGLPLDSKVDYLNLFHDSNVLNWIPLAFESPLSERPDITWEELTDEHCQRIRNHYSLICDDKLCGFLDELSAEFLGTYGYSKGSYDTSKGCYTRGIFTNCTSSANHVVWERIGYLQRCYQRKYNHLKNDCITWSMPGARSGDLFYEKQGVKYYDKVHTMPVNVLAKMANAHEYHTGGYS